MKIPRTQSGIALAIHQLVRQCFSQPDQAVPLIRYRRNLNSSLHIYICNQFLRSNMGDSLSDPKLHFGPGVFKSLSDQKLDLSGVLLNCVTVPGRRVLAFRVTMLPRIQDVFVTFFMVNMKFLYHGQATAAGPYLVQLCSHFIPHLF